MFIVKDIEEVKSIIKEKLNNIQLNTINIHILDSLGKYLSQDVVSDINVPNFNRSTVDGYAVRVSDIFGTSLSSVIALNNLGDIQIGEENNTILKENETMYVPTGGMIPINSDGVVMIENTEIFGDDILIKKQIKPYENIIKIADDIKIGEIVFKKGHKIRPQDLGVLSSLAIEYINVYKDITVTIISTGDEIVNPFSELPLGKVRDVNTYTISAFLKKLGLKINKQVLLNDDYNLIKENILEAINTSDLILISGGSSVGKSDYTIKILEDIEKDSIFTHGINIKPGKPTIFSFIKNKLIIGLPGQVSSALVVFNEFIFDIINYYYNSNEFIKPYIYAKIDTNVYASTGRKTYIMVKFINKDTVTPVNGKSGLISLLSNAYGYIIIDSFNEGIDALETVKVYKL